MKIMFVSLGCDKNLVDTEVMLGMLNSRGHEFTDDENEAEAVVVNTCCFIHDAKQESVNTLLEMAELKKNGVCRVLIACGCLAQRYRQEIIDEIPEVDAVIGTSAYDKIADAIEEVCEKSGINCFEDIDRLPVVKDRRVITTGGYYEYLKIAEGCNKCCTYCIIPKIRGSYRSVPMEELVSQAEYLASQGVKELILVAQETSLYGVDLYGEKSLHKLLHELGKIDGIEWIRVLYCYPEEIDDNLIEAIKTEPKVCHYLDLPIQHASDEVLKRMGRRTTKQDLIDIVGKLRKEIPDICLRTTLITGFPGETDEQHEEVLDFIDELSFDRLGAFTYSAEEDTPAAEFENQVDEEVKTQRRDEIMELQQAISTECSADMVGRTLKVMIEGKLADENVYVGRTYRDAPNVDGYVFVNTDAQLMSGDFIPVRITGSDEYDLMGEPDYEFTE
ncbi:MAG: 30S ribosomal protein S12 methylthiotransferase RimO [Clostridia bacterium]|nr:30S ribosomal protein S12 methylthiotransferase RimO [Clostridia bacterium]